MIKKIGYYILKKLQFLTLDNILIHFAKGILTKKDTSLITSIVRNYFSERYKNATPEKKKELGLLIWKSKASVNYFKDRTFPKKIIDKFTSVIQQNKDFNICEIGTGNGYLLNLLSKHFPDRYFNGIDLSNEQIKIDKTTYESNSKMQFICADILDYVKNNINSPTIYISYVSLTTFTPEMIDKLFKYIAQSNYPAILAIYEPIESNKADGEYSIMRSGLAYSHNYITIAKQNGFTIVEELLEQPFIWIVCKK